MPLAEQIAADLRGAIRAGAYPPRSRLPEARELAEHYDVSTSTIRRVVRLLRDEGLVVSHGRRGVMVL